MAKQVRIILTITLVLLAIFFFGIFSFSSLVAPPAYNYTAHTTQPLSETNSTSESDALKPDEEQPTFTGAIIVGITRPVTILGKEGFSPSNISIKVGDSITWKNEDPQRKRVVLIFQQGREHNKFFSSPALWPEEEWEHTFWEKGEYNYWTTQYGVEGKVTVTPCRNRFCPRKD